MPEIIPKNHERSDPYELAHMKILEWEKEGYTAIMVMPDEGIDLLRPEDIPVDPDEREGALDLESVQALDAIVRVIELSKFGRGEDPWRGKTDLRKE